MDSEVPDEGALEGNPTESRKRLASYKPMAHTSMCLGSSG
jgi:hypothetical protein